MKNWQGIYKKEIETTGGLSKFFQLKITEKKPLIKEITKLVKYDRRILEVGCGTGVISIYLSNLNYNVVAVDRDKNMLKLAKQFLKFTKKPPIFKKQDVFRLNYPKNHFDLVFSHGVLEHFSDKDIITIVNNQLKISKRVLISIPSDYYKLKDRIYGNERFMDVKKWESLLNKTKGRIIKKFGYYFQSKFMYVLNIIMPELVISYAPYIAFVLKKKN